MRLRFPISTLWLALIPLGFAAAVGLSHLLLGRPPQAIRTDLAQPMPVATSWHDLGIALWISIFACLLVACVPYLRILTGAARGRSAGMGLAAVMLASAFSLGTALAMPVIFSSDVYAYAGYALLAAHGVSPYSHATITLSDPLMRAAIWQWSNPLPVCVYGPLFVWIAQIAVTATGALGGAAQLMSLRVISSLALLACGPLIYVALPQSTRDCRAAAAAGLVLNPVAIWIAAEGHNDPIVLAAVLCGFIALRRFGYFIGSLLIAASALIKASGAAAVAVLAIYAWPFKHRLLSILGGFAVGITITGIIARPFESGVRTVLVPHGHYAPQFSLQFLMAQGIHSTEYGVALVVLAAVALAVYGARLALKGELQGAAYIALAVWFAIPNPYPWYALWVLPVAFLVPRSAASWALIAASITIFARYLPDVATAANPDLNVAIACCEVGLPLGILAAGALWTPRRAVVK